jgi:hypothetical protein
VYRVELHALLEDGLSYGFNCPFNELDAFGVCACHERVWLGWENTVDYIYTKVSLRVQK